MYFIRCSFLCYLSVKYDSYVTFFFVSSFSFLVVSFSFLFYEHMLFVIVMYHYSYNSVGNNVQMRSTSGAKSNTRPSSEIRCQVSASPESKPR